MIGLAVVQQTSSTNQLGMTVSKAFTSNVTAGNAIVVLAWVKQGTAFGASGTTGVTTVTDNHVTDTYAKAGTISNESSCDVWFLNQAVGGATTVSVTWQGTDTSIGFSMCIMEISGGKLSLRGSPVTSSANITTGSNTNGSLSNVATCLCLNINANPSIGNVYTIGAGWSAASGNNSGAGLAEYQIASGSTVNGTFTTTGGTSAANGLLVALGPVVVSKSSTERIFGPQTATAQIQSGVIMGPGTNLAFVPKIIR